MRHYVSNLFAWLMQRRPAVAEKPWLIDREGIVYRPTRRVVLRAKS